MQFDRLRDLPGADRQGDRHQGPRGHRHPGDEVQWKLVEQLPEARVLRAVRRERARLHLSPLRRGGHLLLLRASAEGQSQVVVFDDDSSVATPITGDATLPYRRRDGLERVDVISELVQQRRVVSGKFVLRDYDFEKPSSISPASPKRTTTPTSRSTTTPAAMSLRPTGQPRAGASRGRAGGAPHGDDRVRLPACADWPHAHRRRRRRVGEDGEYLRHRGGAHPPRREHTRQQDVSLARAPDHQVGKVSAAAGDPHAHHRGPADGADRRARGLAGRGDPHRQARALQGEVPLGPRPRRGRQGLLLDARRAAPDRRARWSCRASAGRWSSSSSRATPIDPSSPGRLYNGLFMPPYALPEGKTRTAMQTCEHARRRRHRTRSASRTRPAARRS